MRKGREGREKKRNKRKWERKSEEGGRERDRYSRINIRYNKYMWHRENGVKFI